MSDENDRELDRTRELFAFLQGSLPESVTISDEAHIPKLTPDQAWAVIWYLGNQYWQVPDCIERCTVCGELYHSWQEGESTDEGFYCDNHIQRSPHE